jgi:hypothetical protein
MAAIARVVSRAFHATSIGNEVFKQIAMFCGAAGVVDFDDLWAGFEPRLLLTPIESTTPPSGILLGGEALELEIAIPQFHCVCTGRAEVQKNSDHRRISL